MLIIPSININLEKNKLDSDFNLILIMMNKFKKIF